MFCKNCGREIDQKTLKKLMEEKDGSVTAAGQCRDVRWVLGTDRCQ